MLIPGIQNVASPKTQEGKSQLSKTQTFQVKTSTSRRDPLHKNLKKMKWKRKVIHIDFTKSNKPCIHRLFQRKLCAIENVFYTLKERFKLSIFWVMISIFQRGWVYQRKIFSNAFFFFFKLLLKPNKHGGFWKEFRNVLQPLICFHKTHVG